jgi:hypothetical protein
MIASHEPNKTATDVLLWYVSTPATDADPTLLKNRWRVSLEAWLRGSASPRSATSTWRIQFVELSTFILPRSTAGPNHLANQPHWIIVWMLPDAGLADLINRIARFRRAHPSCLQIAAGLSSPAERIILTQVGVSAHVQQPHEWPICNKIMARWLK